MCTNVVFLVAQILVTGFNGRLVVGTEDSPFQHKATITLTGRRGTPDLALARNMNLGSKALGVFGNVSICPRVTIKMHK